MDWRKACTTWDRSKRMRIYVILALVLFVVLMQFTLSRQLDIDSTFVNTPTCQAIQRNALPLDAPLLAEERPSHTQITMATQLTIDRLFSLIVMASNWAPNHVVGALYVPQMNIGSLTEAYRTLAEPVDESWKEIVHRVRKIYCVNPILARNVDIHFVIQGKNYFDKPAHLYPYNTLRNAAISHVETDYVFTVDADFVPCINFVEKLRDKTTSDMATWLERALHEDIALVVPALSQLLVSPETGERIDPRNTSLSATEFAELAAKQLPSNKREVRDKVAAGVLGSVSNRHTHAPTMVPTWLTCDSRSLEVDYYFLWEPFSIVATKRLPRFSEHFKGYQHDKQSHVYELFARRFRFVVMSEVFIVHIQHTTASTVKGEGTNYWTEHESTLKAMYGFQRPPRWEMLPDEYLRLIDNFRSDYTALKQAKKAQFVEVPTNCTLIVPRWSDKPHVARKVYVNGIGVGHSPIPV